jgi:5-methylcytosine-specific restriction endonuclease McrA
MPVRSEERARYPKDWRAISRAIRERGGDRCEQCGAENRQPHPVTGSRVVLTVAHLDHMPENCEPANLRAWCQRCHLAFDSQHHAANAARTRRLKMNALELFEWRNA